MAVHDRFDAPDWIGCVSDLCVDYLEASLDLVRLTQVGAERVTRDPAIIRAANKYREVSGKPERVAPDEAIERAERFASLAQSEIDSDFPLLHAHSLVGEWGAFDAWVEDVVTGWLVNRPADLVCRDKRIRVLCSDILVADPIERAAAVTSALRESVGGSLRSGVAPIEELFAQIGLSGPVPEDLASVIFRTQQIRNVYAHNGGRADRRFVERCPQLGHHVGDQVLVSTETYAESSAALIEYITLVLARAKAIGLTVSSGASA